MKLAQDAVVITGLGMSSSLGNVVTASAAARAGIAAAMELDDFLVHDADGAEEKATGHPVAAANGFQGRAKLLCLAWSALDDLLQNDDLRALDLERTGLILAMPDLDGRREEAPPSPRSFGRGLCADLVRYANLPVPKAGWSDHADGATGFIRAIAEASTALRSARWQHAIVGAVDSLLDPIALGWLDRAGRLKTPTKPDGLQPGEGSAFLLLERNDAAERRGRAILGTVGGTAVGTSLAEAASGALASSLAAGRGKAWLISDHNGEYQRATELGNAIARLTRSAPALNASAPWFPAKSFGDTGAASPAFGACLAVRSFVRKYAAGTSAIVAASAAGGGGAAVRIDAPSDTASP
jgi:3-oxoacyl-[acyl-carrier-protein] synthase I